MVQEKLPSIVFLMEKKCEQFYLEKVKNKLGLLNCFGVNLVGRKRGYRDVLVR